MKHKTALAVTFILAASLLFAPAAQAVEPADGLFAASQEAADSPAWVTKLPAARDENVTQLFIVAGLGMDKTTATVSMHVRDENGGWKQLFTTPAFVGKYGMCLDAEHKEGCGQTPVGTYSFNKAFGIAEDPGCAIPYVRVDEDTYWSGDAREGMHYNEMVDIKDYPDLDLTDSEHIVDYAYEYRYCLNISFNEDGTPGRGSAIFLHCFGTLKPYTGGCVALPEYIMKQVMQRVQPDCVVVIDTLENFTGSPWIGGIPAVEIDYGKSELYTEADMDDAIAVIRAEFDTWEGCELKAVRYAGDENDNDENLKWLNDLAAAKDVFSGSYTDVIGFVSDFHSPVEQVGAWEADTDYTDWQWWLARQAGGDWELLTWGY